jgi:hypothetical protein
LWQEGSRTIARVSLAELMMTFSFFECSLYLFYCYYLIPFEA